jgi:hypothetical protein
MKLTMKNLIILGSILTFIIITAMFTKVSDFDMEGAHYVLVEVYGQKVVWSDKPMRNGKQLLFAGKEVFESRLLPKPPKQLGDSVDEDDVKAGTVSQAIYDCQSDIVMTGAAFMTWNKTHTRPPKDMAEFLNWEEYNSLYTTPLNRIFITHKENGIFLLVITGDDKGTVLCAADFDINPGKKPYFFHDVK